LQQEESEWPKSVRKPKNPIPDGQEQLWLGPVVLDPRIAERMSKFELDPEEEARAERIKEGKEGVRGEGPPVKVGMWEGLMKRFGLKGNEDERKKVILANLDGQDGE
jgi:import inner membrane translocase subunit TIM54